VGYCDSICLASLSVEVQESIIVRIFALIGCNHAKIRSYANLVNDRNNSAHANGNVYYSTETALDKKITDILRVVAEVQTHSESVIGD
jgi:ABC-type phosphate transport system ATPase subunit